MTSQALVVREVATGASLDALAAAANREHGLAEDALSNAVIHAFAAGQALNRAFELVPAGEWQSWVRDHFDGSIPASNAYRRMAIYREELLAHGVESIGAARRFLSEAQLYLGRTKSPTPVWLVSQLSPAEVAEIRRLRHQGVTQREIARICGVTPNTVGRYTNPTYRQMERATSNAAKRRRRQAAAALRREEDAARARSIGGNAGKAYSLIRELTAALSAIRADGGAKQAFEAALGHAYRAEDKIREAIRLT